VFTNDEYLIEIDELESIYAKRIAGIVDGGILQVEVSTIIDFTEDDLKILRKGKGYDELMIYIKQIVE
jgi:tRNA A37 threonylcarbamoyladenosine synthetase subunit TsaC/SUA5/YrdC